MTTTVQQKLSFEQFLDRCPEEGFYELVNGEIVEMRSTRQHDDTGNLFLFAFNDEIRQQKLNYVVNNTALVKTVKKDGTEQARKPDVSVIDRDIWRSDRANYNALDVPIQLAVEITSTNWDDDYIDKLEEYERLGIREYWIVDYLAIASRDFLGNPKYPTVFVFLPDEDGKYQRNKFQGNDIIISPTFPNLKLTVEKILKA